MKESRKQKIARLLVAQHEALQWIELLEIRAEWDKYGKNLFVGQYRLARITEALRRLQTSKGPNVGMESLEQTLANADFLFYSQVFAPEASEKTT
jgi:hypothetical protein